MALIKCIECGNDVSDKAIACPKCGAPIEKSEASKIEEQVKKEEPKIVQPPQAKKNISPWKITTPLIVILLLCVVFIVVKNNPNSIPGIKIEVNTPKPIVITSRADGAKSGLLKARTTVYTTVQNQGGDGNVIVTFHVYQDKNDYERSKQVYLSSNESKDMEVTFEEVKMLGGDITYRVEVKAE